MGSRRGVAPVLPGQVPEHDGNIGALDEIDWPRVQGLPVSQQVELGGLERVLPQTAPFGIKVALCHRPQVQFCRRGLSLGAPSLGPRINAELDLGEDGAGDLAGVTAGHLGWPVRDLHTAYPEMDST